MGKFKTIFAQILDISQKCSEKTGKPKLVFIVDIIFCALKYKASPNNYFYFGFFKKSKKRNTYTTHIMSEKIQKKYNDPVYQDAFYDKYKFSEIFKEFYGRNCVRTDDITEEQYNEFVVCSDKIIYKPTMGGQGKGIKVIHNPQGKYGYIKSLGRGIIETWINQEKRMSDFYPNSVNPIRVTTVFDGNEVHILSATITVGRNSDFANASQDSLFALIDTKTGTIYTDGCDYDLNLYKNHPQTKIAFKGFQIPYWDKVIEMLSKAGKIVPQIGYVGWDIAITDNGPVLIEGNNDPGYVGYQLDVLCPDGIGTKAIYGKYL